MSPTSLSVVAIVDPGNLSTDYYFEWGLTSDYGERSASGPVGACSSTNISQTISGLLPNTSYYVAVVATNVVGSGDATLKASTDPPSPAPVTVTLRIPKKVYRLPSLLGAPSDVAIRIGGSVSGGFSTSLPVTLLGKSGFSQRYVDASFAYPSPRGFFDFSDATVNANTVFRATYPRGPSVSRPVSVMVEPGIRVGAAREDPSTVGSSIDVVDVEYAANIGVSDVGGAAVKFRGPIVYFYRRATNSPRFVRFASSRLRGGFDPPSVTAFAHVYDRGASEMFACVQRRIVSNLDRAFYNSQCGRSSLSSAAAASMRESGHRPYPAA